MKVFLILAFLLSSCDHKPTSDQQQAEQQERILQEGTSQTGMPAIKNFRERKLLKDIIELRDQTGLSTYTYLFTEQTGKLVFLCNSIGYGIPAATQYTNPSKSTWVCTSSNTHCEFVVLPQADPNGLFSPASAEGTWVMCADPNKAGGTKPVYVEPRIVTSPFKLHAD